VTKGPLQCEHGSDSGACSRTNDVGWVSGKGSLGIPQCSSLCGPSPMSGCSLVRSRGSALSSWCGRWGAVHHAHGIAAARARQSDEVVAQTWAKGRAMMLEQAIANALSDET